MKHQYTVGAYKFSKILRKIVPELVCPLENNIKSNFCIDVKHHYTVGAWNFSKVLMKIAPELVVPLKKLF